MPKRFLRMLTLDRNHFVVGPPTPAVRAAFAVGGVDGGVEPKASVDVAGGDATPAVAVVAAASRQWLFLELPTAGKPKRRLVRGEL